MSYRLGVAASRLGAVSRQAINNAGRARLSTTPAGKAPSQPYSPVPKFLAEKMKHFQIPNGLPVHIKGGPVDKILFYFTGAVCTIGVIDCFHVYYQLSYPKAQVANTTTTTAQNPKEKYCVQPAIEVTEKIQREVLRLASPLKLYREDSTGSTAFSITIEVIQRRLKRTTQEKQSREAFKMSIQVKHLRAFLEDHGTFKRSI